jgi:GNAT superfamily N-acetyltransferase
MRSSAEVRRDESDLTFRRGRPGDERACHDLLWQAVIDLSERQGQQLEGSADDWWAKGEPVHQFLASHAAEWWLAEMPGEVSPAGYARSIERAGLFELTELFVRPDQQARGVGRALLERAFPAGRGEVRMLVATTDVRALTRYYAAELTARFPFLALSGPPGEAEAEQLAAQRLTDDQRSLAAMIELERAVLEHPRPEAELRFLLSDREGYLYRRGDVAVGFAFVGTSGAGPIGTLEPADQPDVLRHVESRARALGVESLELEVPGPNEVAVRHLLGRGLRIDPWVTLLMSNRPFGRFDRFIGYSPPIFL